MFCAVLLRASRAAAVTIWGEKVMTSSASAEGGKFTRGEGVQPRSILAVLRDHASGGGWENSTGGACSL